MVLMVQMLLMWGLSQAAARGRVRSRFANDGRVYPYTESLVPTGFRHQARASTSLLAGERFPTTSRERTEGAGVEVKIGITDSPRELVFSSAQTPSEVEALVNTALGKDSDVLSLTDEKGRRFLVNAAKIAYVEIGVADSRRVGFGIGSSAARHG
jgi:Protein of unknown function (DUF3107)